MGRLQEEDSACVRVIRRYDKPALRLADFAISEHRVDSRLEHDVRVLRPKQPAQERPWSGHNTGGGKVLSFRAILVVFGAHSFQLR